MSGRRFSSPGNKRVYTKEKLQKYREESQAFYSEQLFASMDVNARDSLSQELVKCKKAGGGYTRKDVCAETRKAGKRHPFLLQHCEGCPHLEDE